jgi:hypothetical protein
MECGFNHYMLPLLGFDIERRFTRRIFIFPPDIRLLCRLNDLKASGENSCVTVNSREGGRINVFGGKVAERRFIRRLSPLGVNEKHFAGRWRIRLARIWQARKAVKAALQEKLDQ